jgi:hypothetical protein
VQTSPPHGVGTGIELSLDPLDHMLMLPACDAALLGWRTVVGAVARMSPVESRPLHKRSALRVTLRPGRDLLDVLVQKLQVLKQQLSLQPWPWRRRRRGRARPRNMRPPLTSSMDLSARSSCPPRVCGGLRGFTANYIMQGDQKNRTAPWCAFNARPLPPRLRATTSGPPVAQRPRG